MQLTPTVSVSRSYMCTAWGHVVWCANLIRSGERYGYALLLAVELLLLDINVMCKWAPWCDLLDTLLRSTAAMLGNDKFKLLRTNCNLSYLH